MFQFPQKSQFRLAFSLTIRGDFMFKVEKIKRNLINIKKKDFQYNTHHFTTEIYDIVEKGMSKTYYILMPLIFILLASNHFLFKSETITFILNISIITSSSIAFYYLWRHSYLSKKLLATMVNIFEYYEENATEGNQEKVKQLLNKQPRRILRFYSLNESLVRRDFR
jgi:hypothetical protein